MDVLVRELLEDYLAGNLSGTQMARFQAYLDKNPAMLEELARYEQTSKLLAELRPPEPLSPAPGFYARVMQRVDQERKVPFWMFFLQPPFVRRLAFASLMWFAIVGAYVVAFDGSGANTHTAEAFLAGQPQAEYYRVRLGTNLEQNRDSMLAVLMASGE